MQKEEFASETPAETPSAPFAACWIQDRTVRAPSLSIEEIGVGQTKGSVKFPVDSVRSLKTIQVDADVVQQSLSILEITLRRFNVQSASVNRQQLAVVPELVSFGVSAEVISAAVPGSVGRPSSSFNARREFSFF